jgi:hypothetical protein
MLPSEGLSAAEARRQPIFPLSCQPGAGFPRLGRARLPWRGLTVTVGAFRRCHLPVRDAAAPRWVEQAVLNVIHWQVLHCSGTLARVRVRQGSGAAGRWQAVPPQIGPMGAIALPRRSDKPKSRIGVAPWPAGAVGACQVWGQRVEMSDAKGPWHRNFGTAGVCLMSQKTIQAM